MIVVSSNGALAQDSNALLSLEAIRADEPDDVGHEGPSVLDHDFGIVVAIEFWPAKPVQRLQVVIQDLHLVGATVLDTKHSRHVVHNVVEARPEVEGRPIQEPDMPVACEVDVADVRVAMQQCAESRVTLSIVAI